MRIKLFIGFFAFVFLVGCSSIQGPSADNQLKIKVAHLERKLDERDQNIEGLENEVRSLTRDLEEARRAYKQDADNLEIIDVPIEPAKKVSSFQKEKDVQIIRVPVSADQIQAALQSAGYYDGKIDGKIGTKSRDAIREFQADHSLKADGIVGKKTWEELKTYLK